MTIAKVGEHRLEALLLIITQLDRTALPRIGFNSWGADSCSILTDMREPALRYWSYVQIDYMTKSSQHKGDCVCQQVITLNVAIVVLQSRRLVVEKPLTTSTTK